MNWPLLALLLALPLCCFAQAAADLGQKVVVPGDSTVNFQTILAVAVLVAAGLSLIWCCIGIRKRKALARELEKRSQTIEKQRLQESELRKELENKQKELDALQQGTLNRMNFLREDLTFDQQQRDAMTGNRLSLGNALAQARASLV